MGERRVWSPRRGKRETGEGSEAKGAATGLNGDLAQQDPLGKGGRRIAAIGERKDASRIWYAREW